ncbi:MAG: EamA family transporter [Lentisphaeria bacterium]|nr:EamA family transporter [Lentisphaeria bacterium]
MPEKEMLGIVFALCCLVITALNDFMFKLFARTERSKGLFCMIVGLFWTVALSWTLCGSGEINWKATLFWGAVSGIFSAGGNLLLIEGMARQSAGLCSLIYRLNMVPVVLGAGLVLGEIPSTRQYIGIVLALLAIILFQWGSSRGDDGKIKWAVQATIVVGIAAVMRAGMGLSYKYGFTHGADRNWVPFINSLFWIFGGLLYAFLRERGKLKFDRILTGYGAASGVLVAAIVFFMAGSLYYGKAAVVLPIAQMSFIGTFVLGVVFLKEKFSAAHIPALLCGIAAVILLSL